MSSDYRDDDDYTEDDDYSRDYDDSSRKDDDLEDQEIGREDKPESGTARILMMISSRMRILNLLIIPAMI